MLPNDKIRIGVIGVGSIAETAHLPGYLAAHDLCEVVALCDERPARLEELKQKFPKAQGFTQWEDLLAGGVVDAISVCTPNRLHAAPTITALERGIHVLCEKPLGGDGAEARAMCAAAQASGAILQVGLQLRFSQTTSFLREFIRQKKMGSVQYVRAQAMRRRGVPPWGNFIEKSVQGGGPLIDIGVHILDLAIHLMGDPNPVSVTGQTWNTLGTNPEITNFWGDYDRSRFTVEDFAVGMIRFDNGSVVTLESSFMSNGEADPFLLQLYGTKAGAILRPTGSGDEPLRIFREEGKQFFNMTPAFMPSVPPPYEQEVRVFLESIRDGKASPIPGEHGLKLNAIFDALYASAESGREEPVLLLS